MTPALVPTFAAPSRSPSPSHGKQAADTGFHDALSRSESRQDRRHQRADTDLPAARPDRLPHAKDPEGRTLPLRDALPGDVLAEEDAAEVGGAQPGAADRDKEEAAAADVQAAWLDSRVTAAATSRSAAGADGFPIGGEERVEGPASEPTPAAGETIEETVSARGERQSGLTDKLPYDAAGDASSSPSSRAAAEIATIIGQRGGVPAADAPSPATPLDLAGQAALGDDPAEIRLLADPQQRYAGTASGVQQMPYGSAVAMLNLMMQGASVRAGDAQADAPIVPGSMARAGATIDQPSNQAARSTKTPADPDATSTDKAALAAFDELADGKVSSRDARDVNDPDSSSAQPGVSDRIGPRSGEAPLPGARLGTTAAGVVEHLASSPAMNSAKAALHALAQTPGASAAPHTLKIQLRPVELGEITATLRMNGDAITVEMATEKIEAYDRLNVDSDAIVKALRGLGLQVDQITIQPPQASARADGGLPGQASSGGSQQFGQAGGSSGGSEGQRGAAPQGEQRNGGQSRHTPSPSGEDRGARGLFI